MRKTLAIAFVCALIAPAQAQQITAEDVTSFTAALVGYSVKCGRLGPNATGTMNLLAESLDKTQAAVAAINMNAHIQQFGVTRWCAGMKDVVDMLERGGQ